MVKTTPFVTIINLCLIGTLTIACSHRREQPAMSLQNTKEIERIYYIKAINDYIDIVYKKKHHQFDTIYFGKHQYHQPDDFPNISLPHKIKKSTIILLSNDETTKLTRGNTSSYVNMIGDISTDRAQFIFVTFRKGFHHSFDVFQYYHHHIKKNNFQMDSFLIKDYE